MNWFSKLFNTKSSETSESKKKWLKGFHSFEKGKQFYIDRQSIEALQHFDVAIENGFEDEVFELRAACLQELGYHYDAIEDFNKATSLSPEDCNVYFSRSVSKGAIGDYEGEITDLEKAIEISKIDNELNRAYNEEARLTGNKDGVAGMCQVRLIGAKMRLESEKKTEKNYQEMELNATPEQKIKIQQLRAERKKEIKRR